MITFIEFLIVFGAIFMGVRFGGIALGCWGGVGLLVLALVFNVMPGSPPIDVMLIIFAVCLAASFMEVAGGLDVLVRIAARIIRKNPRYVAVVAPIVSFFLTFLCGTGNAVYALYPVIYEVSYNANVRPERAMAGAAVAGQIGITACPISAAMAAMIGLMASNGHPELGLGAILVITFPACLIGVVVGSIICMFRGKELKDDKEYLARVARGEVEAPSPIQEKALSKEAYISVSLFFGAIILIVIAGFFPELRQLPGQAKSIGMSTVIEVMMLAAAAFIGLTCKVDASQVTKSPILTAGVVAVAAVFGIAWMSDSFIAANKDFFMEYAGALAASAPMLFAVVLAIMSALLASQGATTRAVMPLGFALGINPTLLIAMFPAVNCLFILPTSGPALGAVGMNRSGTTKIGSFVFNHSFQFPGLIMTIISVVSAYLIVQFI